MEQPEKDPDKYGIQIFERSHRFFPCAYPRKAGA